MIDPTLNLNKSFSTTTFTPIKTKILSPSFSPDELLPYIHAIKPKSILAISTKIVSLMENRIIKGDKEQLIKEQSQQHFKGNESVITIIQDIIMPTAGIDESNCEGDYMLAWPKNCNESAKKLWSLLRSHINHDKFAIILTDTRTSLMRKGTVGICTGFYGLDPLKDYVGKKDLFGRELKMTKVNVVDSLAAMCVLIMGEGNEQTPLVMIDNIENIDFIPTTQEMYDSLYISMDQDIYFNAMRNCNSKHK